MGAKENAVVKACAEVLSIARIPHFRNNTGAMKGTHKGKGWFVRFGTAGWPDLVGILPGGRFIGIECKSDTGRQTPEQASVAQSIADSGGLYVLCRDTTTLIENLKAEGVRW